MHDIIELWHWRVTDKVSRRHFITRHRMTQADALDFDPAAERVEGSLERRVVRCDPRSIQHQRLSPQSSVVR
ncbi:MAG: hypothetical protein IPJ42_14980 [Betaproteobacteria bacterium]|nr:hypothetical protein [Betaproteobacteria bacterium]